MVVNEVRVESIQKEFMENLFYYPAPREPL